MIDGAALLATAALGPVGGAVAGLAIGTAALGNSVANRDLAGGAVAFGGRYAAVAQGLYNGQGAAVAGTLARGAVGLSVAVNSARFAADYRNCMAGNAG